MVELRESVTADPSRERVFEYLDDPSNFDEFAHTIESVGNVEPVGDERERATVTHRSLRFTSQCTLFQADREPHERLDYELRGEVERGITIHLEDDGEGTEVTYVVEVDTAEVPLPETLAEPLLERLIGRQVRETAKGLEARLRNRPWSPAPGE